MRSFSVLAIGAFLAVISSANAGVVKGYTNKIYFVTHAEPSTNGTGLSSVGTQRAECIANMFGNTSNADIGFIFTQSRDKHNIHQRPYRTVQPLAQELGLDIHQKCHRKDVKCAHKAIKHYIKHHDQNVLISWDAEYMGDIAKGFGASFTAPVHTYDLVYEIDAGQLSANSPYQENCPGLTNSTTSSSSSSSSSSVAASSTSTSSSSVTVTSTSSSASSSVTPI